MSKYDVTRKFPVNRNFFLYTLLFVYSTFNCIYNYSDSNTESSLGRGEVYQLTIQLLEFIKLLLIIKNNILLYSTEPARFELAKNLLFNCTQDSLLRPLGQSSLVRKKF
jgi:hypothetical protein